MIEAPRQQERYKLPKNYDLLPEADRQPYTELFAATIGFSNVVGVVTAATGGGASAAAGTDPTHNLTCKLAVNKEYYVHKIGGYKIMLSVPDQLTKDMLHGASSRKIIAIYLDLDDKMFAYAVKKHQYAVEEANKAAAAAAEDGGKTLMQLVQEVPEEHRFNLDTVINSHIVLDKHPEMMDPLKYIIQGLHAMKPDECSNVSVTLKNLDPRSIDVVMSGFSQRIDCLALLKCYEVPGVTIKDIKIDPNSCEVVIVVSTQAPAAATQQIRKRQRDGKGASRHAKRHSSIGSSMDLVASYSDGDDDEDGAGSSADEDEEGGDGMVDDAIVGGSRFRRASDREMSQRRIASRAGGAASGRRRYVTSGSGSSGPSQAPPQSEVQEVQRIGTASAGPSIAYHRR
jgi:hypothetical protein